MLFQQEDEEEGKAAQGAPAQAMPSPLAPQTPAPARTLRERFTPQASLQAANAGTLQRQEANAAGALEKAGQAAESSIDAIGASRPPPTPAGARPTATGPAGMADASGYTDALRNIQAWQDMSGRDTAQLAGAGTDNLNSALLGDRNPAFAAIRERFGGINSRLERRGQDIRQEHAAEVAQADAAGKEWDAEQARVAEAKRKEGALRESEAADVANNARIVSEMGEDDWVSLLWKSPVGLGDAYGNAPRVQKYLTPEQKVRLRTALLSGDGATVKALVDMAKGLAANAPPPPAGPQTGIPQAPSKTPSKKSNWVY